MYIYNNNIIQYIYIYIYIYAMYIYIYGKIKYSRNFQHNKCKF